MANKNDLFDFDETIASNNDNVQGANIAENCAPGGINNAIRGLASIVKRAVGSQGSAVASAATTAIGAPGTALYTKITGTSAINSFGTVAAGTLRILEFEGALTLTHNATSLILPGAANITTRAGDVALFISEGSGNWRCLAFTESAGRSGMDLLAVQTASSNAQIDFVLTSYASSYRAYKLVLTGVVLATDNQSLTMEFSTNGGSAFDTGASDYAYVFTSASEAGTSAVNADNANSNIALLTGGSNIAARAISGDVTIFNSSNAAEHTKAQYDMTYVSAAGNTIRINGAGRRLIAQDTDAIRLRAGSGNIASGSFALYGLR